MNSDIVPFTFNHSRMIKIFSTYIWFAFLFYVISFWGGGINFRQVLPWYALISRDIVWLGLVIYLGYYLKWGLFRRELWNSVYGKHLKKIAILFTAYLIISLSHIYNRGLAETMQHDIRNILFYSLILPFLPFIVQKKEDINFLLNTFIKIGVVLSVFGIATRYTGIDSLTWSGRIVSTMADPNNLGIFLCFCILIIITNLERIRPFKALIFTSMFSYALVLTTSVTAFLTVNFALFLLFTLKKGLLRSSVICLLILYIFLCFSIISKIVENPDKLRTNFFSTTYNTDKYLIDRLNNMTKNKFSSIFLFNTKFPSPKEQIQSLTHRKSQIFSLLSFLADDHEKVEKVEKIEKIMENNNIVSMVGSFTLKEYATFDHQYLNFIVNSGVISALIFLGLFTWSGFLGLRNFFYYRKTDRKLGNYSLLFSVFLLSMVFVAFNGAALLNRFPLNFLFYFSLGMILLIKEIHKNDNSTQNKNAI